MTTRTAPTPALLAARTAAPTAAAPIAAVPFDRYRWVRAVLDSDLSRDPRVVALVLAHFADDAGYLPPGGPQEAPHLAKAVRLPARSVRLALTALELHGHLHRPDIHTWTQKQLVRPLTLTVPTAAARTEPAHTGEAEG